MYQGFQRTLYNFNRTLVIIFKDLMRNFTSFLFIFTALYIASIFAGLVSGRIASLLTAKIISN